MSDETDNTSAEGDDAEGIRTPDMETVNGTVGQEYEVPPEDEPEKRGGEMGFFDHLEELRWRIIKSLIAMVSCSAICSYFYIEIVEEILLRPARMSSMKLINIDTMGLISLILQVVLMSGLILSIPFITWQIWGFIRPGLYKGERKFASLVVIATIFCFMAGVAFAYFVMIPTSLGFISGIKVGGIENQIAIGSYLSFVLGFILACGAVFEMPMLSYFLSRFGIATPVMLRSYRRHAGVVILIVSAIITPTPDPFNQMLLAIPLYALYEISILVSAAAARQRLREMDNVTSEP